jgi:uncharacterized membrane protein
MHTKWLKIQYFLLIVGGIGGWTAAFTLLLERINYLLGKSSITTCSLDIFVDCGKVYNSPNASLLGFPNVIFGLTLFPMAVVLGVLLINGAKLPKTIWNIGKIPVYFAIFFCIVLLYTSSFIIGALCLWCMLAWTSTTLIVISYLNLAKYHNSNEKQQLQLVQDWNQGAVWKNIVSIIVLFTAIVLFAYWQVLNGKWVELPNPFFWRKNLG